MRAVRSLLLVVAALSPVACSSLNQGTLDGGPGDVASEAALDAADVVDAPAADVVDAPAVDVVDASVIDAPDVPAVDVVDASVRDAPPEDNVDASTMDVVDVPRIDVLDASAMDVVDAPRVDAVDASAMDAVDAPRVDAAVDCGADVLNCSGTCGPDLQSDPLNCGRCGNACALPRVSPQVCYVGACAVGGCATTEFGDCDHYPQNGCESSLVSNPSHCGACGNACPPRPNASVTCSMRVCGFTCLAGFGDCDGVATNGCEATLSTDTANCGACGRPCGDGNGCVAGSCVPIPTPRQRAPLSTSTVTSQSPSLRWINGPGATGAVIHLANNPSFVGETSIAVPNGNAVSLNDIAPGTWYWYAQGVSRTATNTGAQVSPVWQFIVGNRSAPVDSSFGTISDFNRDGYGDFVAGAPDSVVAGGSIGRVRLYLGGAAGIVGASVTLQAGGPETGSVLMTQYGSARASAGDTNGAGDPDLLVFGQGAAAGRVVGYNGTNTGIATTPARVLTGGAGTSNFGRSVSSAGDVNGDGYADVIIGENDSAYVFLGSATGLVTADPVQLAGLLGEDYGHSVSSAGDVNADGYGDVVVGAPDANGRGVVMVFRGRAASPHITTGPTFMGVVGDGRYGISVSGVGDADGDGYGDLLVGAAATGTLPGAAYLLRSAGTPGAGTSLTLDPSAMTPGYGGRFGIAVSGIGDANHDGLMDFVVGARCAQTTPNCGPGLVYYFRGGRPPLATHAAFFSTSDAAGSNFGAAVALRSPAPRFRRAK